MRIRDAYKYQKTNQEEMTTVSDLAMINHFHVAHIVFQSRKMTTREDTGCRQASEGQPRRKDNGVRSSNGQ